MKRASLRCKSLYLLPYFVPFQFLPPPRFRRWMNRFMRRWHQRNQCEIGPGLEFPGEQRPWARNRREMRRMMRAMNSEGDEMEGGDRRRRRGWRQRGNADENCMDGVNDANGFRKRRGMRRMMREMNREDGDEMQGCGRQNRRRWRQEEAGDENCLDGVNGTDQIADGFRKRHGMRRMMRDTNSADDEMRGGDRRREKQWRQRETGEENCADGVNDGDQLADDFRKRRGMRRMMRDTNSADDDIGGCGRRRERRCRQRDTGGENCPDGVNEADDFRNKSGMRRKVGNSNPEADDDMRGCGRRRERRWRQRETGEEKCMDGVNEADATPGCPRKRCGMRRMMREMNPEAGVEMEGCGRRRGRRWRQRETGEENCMGGAEEVNRMAGRPRKRCGMRRRMREMTQENDEGTEGRGRPRERSCRKRRDLMKAADKNCDEEASRDVPRFRKGCGMRRMMREMSRGVDAEIRVYDWRERRGYWKRSSFGEDSDTKCVNGADIRRIRGRCKSRFRSASPVGMKRRLRSVSAPVAGMRRRRSRCALASPKCTRRRSRLGSASPAGMRCQPRFASTSPKCTRRRSRFASTSPKCMRRRSRFSSASPKCMRRRSRFASTSPKCMRRRSRFASASPKCMRRRTRFASTSPKCMRRRPRIASTSPKCMRRRSRFASASPKCMRRRSRFASTSPKCMRRRSRFASASPKCMRRRSRFASASPKCMRRRPRFASTSQKCPRRWQRNQDVGGPDGDQRPDEAVVWTRRRRFGRGKGHGGRCSYRRATLRDGCCRRDKMARDNRAELHHNADFTSDGEIDNGKLCLLIDQKLIASFNSDDHSI